jgi:hypothetical protein
MGGEIGEGGREETRELFARHFARSLCEVAVASSAEPAHIAFNRDFFGLGNVSVLVAVAEDSCPQSR